MGQRAAISAEIEDQRDQISTLIEAFVVPEMIGPRVNSVQTIGPPHEISVDMKLPSFPHAPGPFTTREGASFAISVNCRVEINVLASSPLNFVVAALGKMRWKRPLKSWLSWPC